MTSNPCEALVSSGADERVARADRLCLVHDIDVAICGLNIR